MKVSLTPGTAKINVEGRQLLGVEDRKLTTQGGKGWVGCPLCSPAVLPAVLLTCTDTAPSPSAPERPGPPPSSEGLLLLCSLQLHGVYCSTAMICHSQPGDTHTHTHTHTHRVALL